MAKRGSIGSSCWMMSSSNSRRKKWKTWAIVATTRPPSSMWWRPGMNLRKRRQKYGPSSIIRPAGRSSASRMSQVSRNKELSPRVRTTPSRAPVIASNRSCSMFTAAKRRFLITRIGWVSSSSP
ncbi:MAG: hypothetical protein LC689_20675 [Myxococcales bacterium]|nr:hypothetical protein [Myxococcales bacterium]